MPILQARHKSQGYALHLRHTLPIALLLQLICSSEPAQYVLTHRSTVFQALIPTKISEIQDQELKVKYVIKILINTGILYVGIKGPLQRASSYAKTENFRSQNLQVTVS